MINPTKKIFSSINLQESIFPAVRVLIVILFLVSLIFSLRFVYKIINETLIVKPTVTQKPFFDIERFKKIAPQWGINVE